MPGSKKGFTLLELMVVLALGGLAMASIYRTFSAQQKVYVVQDQVVGVQQDLRAAMEIMVKELRMIGYDPRGSGYPRFLQATASLIQFQADLDGDGEVVDADSDPGERIKYACANGGLGRAGWAGTLQPVADNVQTLNFVYLDENGAVIPSPGTDTAALARIRSIQVTIVARTAQMDKEFRNTTPYSNQQGTVLLVAQNDSYRRRILTTTVHCRNLGLGK
jgi:type IV pilus assembly protein PilW